MQATRRAPAISISTPETALRGSSSATSSTTASPAGTPLSHSVVARLSQLADASQDERCDMELKRWRDSEMKRWGCRQPPATTACWGFRPQVCVDNAKR